MKLLKYLLITLMLVGSTTVMAATQKKENPHWFYTGVEVGEKSISSIIGHRYKIDDCIIDANVTYAHHKYAFHSFSCSKFSTNLFKVFYDKEKTRLYGGIGVKIITGGKKYRFHHLYKDFAVLGALTLGKERSFEKGCKLFAEVFYCPFSWGYRHSSSLGWKIGLSL